MKILMIILLLVSTPTLAETLGKVKLQEVQVLEDLKRGVVCYVLASVSSYNTKGNSISCIKIDKKGKDDKLD